MPSDSGGTESTHEHLPFYPGPVPQDETAISDQASFIEACKAVVTRDAEQFGWSFGNSIVTRSKDGCLVWRVDFDTPRTAGQIRDVVNRVVCWQPPGSDDISLAVLFSQPFDKLKSF
jgi:hypothetical protein